MSQLLVQVQLMNLGWVPLNRACWHGMTNSTSVSDPQRLVTYIIYDVSHCTNFDLPRTMVLYTQQRVEIEKKHKKKKREVPGKCEGRKGQLHLKKMTWWEGQMVDIISQPDVGRVIRLVGLGLLSLLGPSRFS